MYCHFVRMAIGIIVQRYISVMGYVMMEKQYDQYVHSFVAPIRLYG